MIKIFKKLNKVYKFKMLKKKELLKSYIIKMNFKKYKRPIVVESIFFTKFKNKIKGDTKNLILIEFNEMLDCYIPYAYLTSQLSKNLMLKFLHLAILRKKLYKFH